MSEKQQPKRRGPMHGGPAAMRPAEKAKDFKGTFKKLMAYLRAYWLPLVLMIVFAVASTVFTMVSRASTGYLPEAVSPESITQLAPSKTALATSETSARVGRGLRIIESSI